MKYIIAIFALCVSCGTVPGYDVDAGAATDTRDSSHQDASERHLHLGCYLDHEGRRLYQSLIAPDGQSGCCEYYSLDPVPPRQIVQYCTESIAEAGREGPFYVVEVDP